MENASKALLMAGGILIAIIIIALLVSMFSGIGAFQRQKLSEEEIARIEHFNKQFTKYQNQYVYGTEVITITNMMYNEKEHPITAEIEFSEEYSYKRKVKRFGREIEEEITILKGEVLTITNDDGESIGIREDSINILKTKAFKCTEIKYNKNTGRVEYIKFVEKQYSDIT